MLLKIHILGFTTLVKFNISPLKNGGKGRRFSFPIGSKGNFSGVDSLLSFGGGTPIYAFLKKILPLMISNSKRDLRGP